MRKPVHRRTVDYSSTVVRYIQVFFTISPDQDKCDAQGSSFELRVLVLLCTCSKERRDQLSAGGVERVCSSSEKIYMEGIVDLIFQLLPLYPEPAFSFQTEGFIINRTLNGILLKSYHLIISIYITRILQKYAQLWIWDCRCALGSVIVEMRLRCNLLQQRLLMLVSPEVQGLDHFMKKLHLKLGALYQLKISDPLKLYETVSTS